MAPEIILEDVFWLVGMVTWLELSMLRMFPLPSVLKNFTRHCMEICTLMMNIVTSYYMVIGQLVPHTEQFLYANMNCIYSVYVCMCAQVSA